MIDTLSPPLAGQFRISQAFGARYLYFGQARTHQGVDFACPKNTPVLASHAGRVSFAKLDASKTGYGNELRLEFDGGFTQYAHLESFAVKLGDQVAVGDTLGHSGNSGFTLGVNGEHLHFGFFQNGAWRDPAPLLTAKPLPPTDNRRHAGLETVKVYAVKLGDTLATIAAEYYGEATEWPRIFAENKFLLRDANKIKPGQKLILPDL